MQELLFEKSQNLSCNSSHSKISNNDSDYRAKLLKVGKIGEKDVLGLSIFYAIDFWALLSHNQGHSKPYVDFYVMFF